nr:hypothetical protein [Pseudoroseomonas oryzae]
MTPLLKRLQTAGLIKRTRNAEDERQVRIHLTEQSVALHDKTRSLPIWLERTFCEQSEEAKSCTRPWPSCASS